MTRLIIVSLVSGPLFLLAFKKLSNQDKIRAHKNQMVGYLLEIRLYKDYLIRTLSSMSGILKHYLLYLWYLLPPMLVLCLPLLFICLQLESRFGRSPLSENDVFFIHAELDGDHATDADLFEIRCDLSSNIELQTPSLRVTEENSVYWRAKVNQEAKNSYVRVYHSAASVTDAVEKEITTDEATGQPVFSDLRKIKKVSDIFLFGGESIPKGSVFRSVAINYPVTKIPLIFWHLSPVSVFLILTIFTGMLAKPLIKVWV